jgi:hypothetical protein
MYKIKTGWIHGWYTMRKYPILEIDTELQKVRVSSVDTLGDGTTIVTYVHNYPAPITEHMKISEFIKNIVMK